MADVIIPDLMYYEALKFCKDFEKYEWKQNNTFDFRMVKTCEPFAMLCVGRKLLELRQEHAESECKGLNANLSYAENMRLFRFIGMKKGRPLELDCGNENYQPISFLDFMKMYEESRKTKRQMGEIVTDVSRKLAVVLSRNNESAQKAMTYCLREIIRNIPEHSNSLNGWYCAQYWPTKDRVELAIIDDGRGILNSINSNKLYAAERLSNEEAIKKALQSGVSRTYDESGNEEIFAGSGNNWKNSGYGLYMVSRICAKTGGDFVLASGDTSVKLENDVDGHIKYNSYPTSISGTAIRIRFKVSGLNRIDDIINEINAESNSNDIGFKTPSRASNFYFI